MYLRGDIFGRLDCYQEAFNNVEPTLSHFRDQHIRTLDLLGDLYRLKGDPKRGLEFFRTAARIDDLTEPGPRMDLRRRLAYTALQAASDSDPADPLFEEAERAFQEALDQNGGDAMAVLGLGLVAEKRGLAEEAEALFQEAFEIQNVNLRDPNPGKHFLMARIQAKLGDLDAALGSLGSALSGDPTYAVYANRDRELKILKDDPGYKGRFDALFRGAGFERSLPRCP